jgi:hypothetical protein
MQKRLATGSGLIMLLADAKEWKLLDNYPKEEEEIILGVRTSALNI